MMKLLTVVSVVGLLALSCGCTDHDAAITTDMHEDFDHQHKHQHTDEDDHEHDHKEEFRGSHSHGHGHNHRHGEPLHGGRIVSIGHAHHKDGATHFHAEVMPLADNTVRFYLLTETDDGKSSDVPIEAKEITALISIQGQEATASECIFKAVGDGDVASEFSAVLPERFFDAQAFNLVIPKVKLGGQRQNFSFKVNRSPEPADPGEPTSSSKINTIKLPDDETLQQDSANE